MISDMHVHTSFSSDSQTPARQQIQRAIELGMPYICVTDHQDYDAPPLAPDNFTFLIGDTDDMKGYLAALASLREEFSGQIKVLYGIELGLQGHLGERLRNFEKAWPLDFIIGSSHYFGGLDGGDRRLYEGRSGKEACAQYFEEELENLTAFPDYDVIGHLDFVLRHAPGGPEEFHYGDYGDVLDEILLQAIGGGKGIECNTCPMRSGGSQPNPNGQILSRYAQLGGEILTFGSDAHTPEWLGARFEEAAQLAKSCGLRYYAVFENRKPIFYPL